MPNTKSLAGNNLALANDEVTLTNERMFAEERFPHYQFSEKKI